ncbi:MAG: methyltransferase domain-containing protein [Candidatus Moraniibacteriota bacterium]|nr:MAG: methyltransferase domain-containing protein [Candidatus Moranbacteria bacterium]
MSIPKGLVFVEPKQVIRELAVGAGDTVADFGAGSGYFSFEFARAVGSEGKVYALDVLPSALEAIVSRAKTLGLSNIAAERVNLERPNGSGLGTGSIDWVIVKDVLMQNKDKTVILREVHRILKPDGRAILIEWHPEESTVGPDKELRIHPDDLRTLVNEAGLEVVEEPAVGGFHYAFVVKKS